MYLVATVATRRSWRRAEEPERLRKSWSETMERAAVRGVVPCRRAWNSFRTVPALLVPRFVAARRRSVRTDRPVLMTETLTRTTRGGCRRANFSEAAPQWGLVSPAAAPLDVAVAVRRRSKAAKGSHFDHTPPVVKLVRRGRVPHRLTLTAPRREHFIHPHCLRLASTWLGVDRRLATRAVHRDPSHTAAGSFVRSFN